MDEETRRRLVERYKAGPAEVEQLVAGLDNAALDTQPADGGWTPRQVVHHLADSEMTSAIRLRRLLAEDSPMISGYDEAEWARRLRYRERPIAPSLAAVRAARETSASILEQLSDAEWQRAGTHSDSGAYSVETWLGIYTVHCHDHADQIRRALGVALHDMS